MNTSIKNRWLQHFILLSAPLLTVIDVFIVNISIPSIKRSMDASDAQVELVIASYLLGYASFMITGGRAGDYWGRKKVFVWGMLTFIVTSCICGMASSPALLIAARFFQGVSGAFMTHRHFLTFGYFFLMQKKEQKPSDIWGSHWVPHLPWGSSWVSIFHPCKQ